MVDWVPAQPDGRPLLANFLFDGGTITECRLKENARLDSDELSQWCLADAADLDGPLIPLLDGRVRAALHALANGTAALPPWRPAPRGRRRPSGRNRRPPAEPQA